MEKSKYQKKDSMKVRKLEFIDNYYTDDDYDEVLKELPIIINEAERRSNEVLEPTIQEKKAVRQIIINFIKSKGRKIYGGTALNETLKLVNVKDAIYDEYCFSDIEFYSPTPIPDLVELCNILHEKKFKYIQGKEAQHEETYSIFVNFLLYCDITYVPARIYNGIKVIEIDGVKYSDPHFMLIDYLRMINQPLTAAGQRWEKAFKRMYKLLKNYPLEYFDKNINLPEPNKEFQSYMIKIRRDFMLDTNIQKTCLITGFEAYNFYIKYAANDKNIDTVPSRVSFEINLEKMVTNVPYLEFVSVSYKDTVEKLYNFIKKTVSDPKEITLEEYFPLFQFTGYSIIFKYKDVPLARIYEADGYCVPSVKTSKGYMFVSYQYLLMTMLISKFRTHLDKDRVMYFNYGLAISNLATARNEYLTKNNLGVINKTIFGEFKISCVGSTLSYIREAQLRYMEKSKQGKTPFKYVPEIFFKSSQESQEKFDPTRHLFKNTSGNRIMNPKNILFKIDDKGNIVENLNEESEVSSNEENSTNERVQKSDLESSDFLSDSNTKEVDKSGNSSESNLSDKSNN